MKLSNRILNCVSHVSVYGIIITLPIHPDQYIAGYNASFYFSFIVPAKRIGGIMFETGIKSGIVLFADKSMGRVFGIHNTNPGVRLS